MPKFTVTISDDGLKAAEAADGGGCYSFRDWIQNAANQKVRRSIDTLIEEKTNLNFKKLPPMEKEVCVSEMSLETAKEKTDKFEREMREAEA